jgi:S-adenosylmethionine decarboxylase
MPLGTHLIIDARDCESLLLSDLGGLEKLMVEAVEACGADVVGSVKKQFTPKGKAGKTGNGVTLGVLIGLGESHASIHSYPELGKWLADVCLCGRLNPEEAYVVLRTRLGGTVNVTRMERG